MATRKKEDQGKRKTQNNTGTQRKDGKPKLNKTQCRKTNCMRRAINLLQMEYEYNEIVEMLMDEFGYAENTVQRHILNAKKIVSEKFKDFAAKTANKNYKYLETAIEEAYSKGKYNQMIEAINTQNKMANIYSDTLNIKTDTPFIISLGNDLQKEENYIVEEQTDNDE